MWDKIWVAVSVGVVVMAASAFLTNAVHLSVRKAEHKANENTEPPSRRAIAWHLVHVRDDIGSLVIVGPHVTNALLAAILAVLVMG